MVDDTPYTLTELRRDFGAGVAGMVAGISAHDHIGRSRHYKVAQALAAIGSVHTHPAGPTSHTPAALV